MEENANAYSEVIEVLKLLDDEKKLEALPIDMLEVLKSKANPEYKPQISKEISLDEQNLQPETYSILSWIAMKYWGYEIDNDSNIEENKLEGIKTEIEKSEGQSIEKDSKEDIEKELSKDLPVLQADLKWYQRIKARIVSFFNMIFGKK